MSRSAPFLFYKQECYLLVLDTVPIIQTVFLGAFNTKINLHKFSCETLKTSSSKPESKLNTKQNKNTSVALTEVALVTIILSSLCSSDHIRTCLQLTIPVPCSFICFM